MVGNPVTELDSRFSSRDAAPTPWSLAREELIAAQVYWLSTVRPDGRPHVTSLLAVWVGSGLYFCTGSGERKAKNLDQNPTCVLTTGRNELEGIDLIVEGRAVIVTDEGERGDVAEAYELKYGPRFTEPDGTWFGLGDAIRGGEVRLYRVSPSTVFGFAKGTFGQTRWRFEPTN